MSSTFRPLLGNSMLPSGAFTLLTLLGCAGNATPTETDESPVDGTEEDAGKEKKDAGGTSTKKDASATLPRGEPGDDCEGTARAECTGCDEEPCFVTCEDGSYGDCVSVEAAIRDAGVTAATGGNTGLPDGSTVSINDGSVSVKVGDASVAIKGMDCPSPLMCSNKSMSLAAPAIMMLSGGAPICVDPSTPLGTPPSCTTVADCTTRGLKQATCMPDVSGILGGSICLAICK